MDGLVLQKTDGARNEWLAEWNGEYCCDLGVVGYEQEEGESLNRAVEKAWLEATGMNPTPNQVHWVRTATLVLDNWYESGQILAVGRYVLVGDHLKVVR